MSEATLLPAELEAAWTAEIEWRGGPEGARFCAVARRADGAGAHVVAESAPVAWPPAGPAGVEALTNAHRALGAALARTGWKPLSPGSAWYATRFAWEPVAPAPRPARARAAPPAREPRSAPRRAPPEPPAEAGPFAPAPAWPDDSKELWRCEIRWDAGWIDSRFQAVTYRPRGRRGRSIGASGPTKWRLMGQPEPDRPEHREAVHDLASALETAGWERVGQGADWYSERFWWRGEGAPRSASIPHLAVRSPRAEMISCRKMAGPHVYDPDEPSS